MIVNKRASAPSFVGTSVVALVTPEAVHRVRDPAELPVHIPNAPSAATIQ
jgi:hypothetical protein